MSDRGILVLGAGYTGALVAQRLAFDGRPVWGTTRSETRASVIRSWGAEPVMVDALEDLSPIDRLRGRIAAVVHSIPPRVERGGERLDPTAAILRRVVRWDLDALVYVSSTTVYGDRGGERTDESTPTAPESPRGHARVEAEQRVLEAAERGDVPGMVVRPSGIYGRGRSLLHRLAGGRGRIIGEGTQWTNRIHVHDLASHLMAALDRGRPGAVYLASDARPMRQHELYELATATYGMPEPARWSLDEARVRLSPDVLAMATASKLLDGSATRRELDLELRFPDVASGLADVWRWEAPELRAAAAGEIELRTPSAGS